MPEVRLDSGRDWEDMEIHHPNDEAHDSASKGPNADDSDTEGAACEDESSCDRQAIVALVASVFPLPNGQSSLAFRPPHGKSSQGL